MNWPLRMFVVVSLALSSASHSRADPSPEALLRGVVSSRESWRGTLVMAVTIEGIRPKTKSPRVVKLEIAFDQGKRRFIQEEKALIVRAPKPGEKPTPGERFREIGLDSDRAIALGIARWVHERTRAAFDGTAAYECTDSGSPSIIDPKKGVRGLLCFDLRTLGLVANPTFHASLEEQLGLKKEVPRRVVGREVIRDQSVWHVVVERTPGKSESHFWIEDKAGHRVHRFERILREEKPEDTSRERAELYYDKDSPFPKEVVLEQQRPNNHSVGTYRVEKIDFGARVDPAVFGLAGLEIPPGAMVIDTRIHERIGYWDGKGVTEERTVAVQRFADDAAGRWRWRDHAWQVALVALGLALAVAGVWYFRRARARNAT